MLEANLLRPFDTLLATLDTWRRHGKTQLSEIATGDRHYCLYNPQTPEQKNLQRYRTNNGEDLTS